MTEILTFSVTDKDTAPADLKQAFGDNIKLRTVPRASNPMSMQYRVARLGTVTLSGCAVSGYDCNRFNGGFFQFITTTQGSLNVRIGSRSVDLGPGEGGVVGPRQEYLHRMTSGGGVAFYLSADAILKRLAAHGRTTTEGELRAQAERRISVFPALAASLARAGAYIFQEQESLAAFGGSALVDTGHEEMLSSIAAALLCPDFDNIGHVGVASAAIRRVRDYIAPTQPVRSILPTLLSAMA